MNIIYKPSAFEHEISESNIRYAFMNPYYDGPIEEDSNGENYGNNDRRRSLCP